MAKKLSLKERLLAKIEYAENGCWVWTGCVVRRYGQIGAGDGRKRLRAHRASYMIFKGSIPDGLVIDHLCRNPLCVNPDHLEAVTVKENTYRGYSPTARRQRLGYCAHGHEINSVNTYFNPRTGYMQHCRVCMREQMREKRKQKRGAA